MNFHPNWLPYVVVVLMLVFSSRFIEQCSAYNIRECEFVSEGPQMCDGDPYFEQIVSTPGFCEMYRCQSDPVCAGFTFFASTNRCALFEICNKDTLVDCVDNETCLTGLCYESD